MDKTKPAPGDGKDAPKPRPEKSPAEAQKPPENQPTGPQQDAAPGELLTGEGAPGLALTGGGGHA